MIIISAAEITRTGVSATYGRFPCYVFFRDREILRRVSLWDFEMCVYGLGPMCCRVTLTLCGLLRRRRVGSHDRV